MGEIKKDSKVKIKTGREENERKAERSKIARKTNPKKRERRKMKQHDVHAYVLGR
jgi:hypothetical protein